MPLIQVAAPSREEIDADGDVHRMVAREYVAAQDANDPGVLVLSRFAGAAERLLDAQLVDPYDTGAIADTLQRTLQISLDERRQRHQALLAEIRRHDVHRWRGMFLDTSKQTSS